MGAAGLKPGDVAGLALSGTGAYAWLGVERGSDGFTLAQFDEQTGKTSRVPLEQTGGSGSGPSAISSDNTVCFSYSTDGRRYAGIGEPCSMGDGPDRLSGHPVLAVLVQHAGRRRRAATRSSIRSW